MLRRLLFLLVPILAMARPRIPVGNLPTFDRTPPSTPPPGVSKQDYHPSNTPQPPISTAPPIDTDGPIDPATTAPPAPTGPPPGVSRDDFDATLARNEGDSGFSTTLLRFADLIRSRAVGQPMDFDPSTTRLQASQPYFAAGEVPLRSNGQPYGDSVEALDA